MDKEQGNNYELDQQEGRRQAEAKEIMERIGDKRLRTDEHLEYFTLHLAEGVKHVPKRRIRESEDTNRYIELHLRDILNRENQINNTKT